MTRIKPSQGRRIDPATVPGWGVDADPRNDPTYPYRQRLDQAGSGMDWDRPPLQDVEVEVLHSVEHNRTPAVKGTTYPPRGVSGMIRRKAFDYSESDWRHWLMLLASDRVDVMEGLLVDLANGRIPNIPKEMGIRAEWKHNRSALLSKAAALGAVSLLAVALFRSRQSRRRRAALPPPPQEFR